MEIVKVTMSPQNNVTAQYFLSGVAKSLLKKDYRELTIIASTFSVIALMILGSCVWCLAHFCKRKGTKKVSIDRSSEENSDSGLGTGTFFEGWKPETSLTLRQKMSSSSGSNGKSKHTIYKDIITPDKNIEFVIPTIQMPAQPSSYSSSDREMLPEVATCSKNMSLSQCSIPTEFYPQLEQGEEQSPKIGFNLYYEASTQILYVRLLGGRNFPEQIRHCIAVKLYPGRGGKQKTREFEEINPVYNQEFSFHIRKSTLCTRVLRFKGVILETPKKVVGCLNLALKDLPGFEVEDAQQDLQTTQLWKFLEQPSDTAGGIRLRVSLQWQEDPQPGLLTLKVIEASGLHETNGNDYTSSHVKVTLQEQGRNIKSRKTRLVRWGSVPVYDDVFVVCIPQDLLSQISFLMEVIARGRLGSKVVLGKISIGSMPYVGPSTDCTDFWEDMCHQPNTEIVRWLQLVSLN